MMGLIVEKEKVAANGDYNLSGERYRDTVVASGHYPPQALSELLEIQSGFPFKSELFNEESGVPIIRIRDIKPNRTVTKYKGEYDPAFLVQNGDLLIGMDGEFNSVIWNGGPALLNQRVSKLHSFTGCVKEYVALLIPKKLKEIEDGTYAVTVKHISGKQINAIEIPLPPLEVQKEIVVEIESYQKVINGARAVLDNYRPNIVIHPDWPIIELGEVSNIKGGYAFKSSDFVEKGVRLIRMGNVKKMLFDHQNSPVFLPNSFKNDYRSYVLEKGDILISMTGTIGKEDYGNVCMIDIEGDFLLNQRVGKFEIDTSKLNPLFIYYVAQSEQFRSSLFSHSSGGVRQANISNKGIEEVKIPLPSLTTQQAIVAEIEAEQTLVAANRELIARFEKKIQNTLARVWGEDKPAPVEA
jgi:type I restriction enzyme M protein